ncbi:hypothetical protein H0H87_002371 [Tephrocybe sp. NHM501043]|nr:hypothetical protein H0H87_002371 [Tephrocybe sp. NHM501043]
MSTDTSGRHALSWRTPPVFEAELLSCITRTYIRTPSGVLELLVAQPRSKEPTPRKKALLFQHGGFGSAVMWIPFLVFFSQKHGYPCYAASLRGHGASWNPGYFRMVFGTGRASFAADLVYILNCVQGFEAGYRGARIDPEDIILVGHSAGGGLAQYILSRNQAQVGGLVLMASFPNFGGFGVYWNWGLLDPYFALRMYFRDFAHPRSPLSSTALVHRAFFSPSFPTASVQAFEHYLAAYESLLWPLSMMLPFVDVRNVLRNCLGWGSALTARVLVIAGAKDALMGVELMRRMAEQYRSGVTALVRRRQLGVDLPLAKQESTADAVDFAVIDTGHHIQNDLRWEDGAMRILAFLEQL